MGWSQSVFSEMAATVGYVDEGMIVRFNSGKTVLYLGVPEDVARDIANAASVGQAINSEIKGKYKFRYV